MIRSGLGPKIFQMLLARITGVPALPSGTGAGGESGWDRDRVLTNPSIIVVRSARCNPARTQAVSRTGRLGPLPQPALGVAKQREADSAGVRARCSVEELGR